MEALAGLISGEASLPDLQTAASLLCPLLPVYLGTGRGVFCVSSSSYRDSDLQTRASLCLNHLPKGPISKHGHLDGSGFNI